MPELRSSTTNSLRPPVSPGDLLKRPSQRTDVGAAINNDFGPALEEFHSPWETERGERRRCLLGRQGRCWVQKLFDCQHRCRGVFNLKGPQQWQRQSIFVRWSLEPKLLSVKIRAPAREPAKHGNFEQAGKDGLRTSKADSRCGAETANRASGAAEQLPATAPACVVLGIIGVKTAISIGFGIAPASLEISQPAPTLSEKRLSASEACPARFSAVQRAEKAFAVFGGNGGAIQQKPLKRRWRHCSVHLND